MIDDTAIENCLNWLRDNALKAAEARAHREYLDNFTKTLLAQIMKEHVSDSLGAQEREARADRRYVTHLEGLREAVKNDEQFRWLKSAAEARIEAWRTLSSNARAQVKVN